MGFRFKDHYEIPKNPWGSPPGIVNNEYKVLTTSIIPNAIYTEDIIKVEPVAGAINTHKITWPAVNGAADYTIFAGFSPFISQSLEIATTTDLTYTYRHPKSVPPDTLLHVWIRANTATPSYIQDVGATIEGFANPLKRENTPLEYSYSANVVDNDYMRFIFAEVRRRAIVMQENDGEPFIIYVRRWTGTPCDCAYTDANLVNGPDAIQGAIIAPDQGIGEEPTDSNPKYDGLHRCPKCLGTGIVGGYYYGQSTLLRYGNLPRRTILFKDFAIDLPHNFNSWAVWAPRLHEHDLVYRVKTGEYFIIDELGRSELRGISMHQEMKLNLLPPNDFRCTVTDAAIQQAENL